MSVQNNNKIPVLIMHMDSPGDAGLQSPTSSLSSFSSYSSSPRLIGLQPLKNPSSPVMSSTVMEIFDTFSEAAGEKTQSNSAVPFTATPPSALSNYSPISLPVPVATILGMEARKPKPHLTIEIEDSVVGEITFSNSSVEVLLNVPKPADPSEFGWMSKFKRAVYAPKTENRFVPVEQGKNGARFVRDSGGNIVCVLKAQEEELGASKCAIRQTEICCAKRGIEPGEGARTEYLAWKVGHFYNSVIDIPETIYAKVVSSAFIPSGIGTDDKKHVTRYCSVQEFVPGCKTFDDCSIRVKEKISIRESQAIAFFDILMFNADRNGNNLLVAEPLAEGEKTQFVAIDHGCCLPRNAESPGVFCWQSLPQLLESIDPQVVEFIEKLPQTGFCESKAFESLDAQRKNTHYLAVQFLKEGLDSGLNLYEIASFFTQTDESEQSVSRLVMRQWLQNPSSPLEKWVRVAVLRYATLFLMNEDTMSVKEACDAAMKDMRETYMRKLQGIV